MLNYKEFYFWLDGFMTNKCWASIKKEDIETIQGKMKQVGDSDTFFPNPTTIAPHILGSIPIPTNPFKMDDDELGRPPKIIM